MRVLLLCVMSVLLASCGVKKTPTGPTRPPGLYAEPAQVAFTCVNLGCDETKVVRVTVSGDRRVAVKRLLLSGPAAADFSFTSSETPPFIVGSGASFEVTIRYSPTGAPAPGSVVVAADYTDASPDESPTRLPPGSLPIPLVRRLVGEPELVIAPTALHYGVVPTGKSKKLELRVFNGGFGNVALDVSALDAGSTGITVALPEQRSMIADSGIVVPMTWSPKTPEYLHTELEVTVSTPGVPSGRVLVEGTSLYYPRIAVEPTNSLDFGEVPKGHSRRLPIEVVNQGGSDLVVTRLDLTDSLGAIHLWAADGGELPLDGGASLVVGPLGRELVTLELNGATPGELDGQLALTSNDQAAPLSVVSLKGTVTEPKVLVSPSKIDFGTVPQGWVVTRALELRNTGFGSLTLKNITFVAGSSSLYSLVNLPALPLHLKRDQRVALEVQFRAETAATFNGSVSVETDDLANSFAEVPVTVRVGSCAEGCPITNGSPACNGGVCSIEKCDPGWYDTDGLAADGCECHDLAADPGEFCSDATDMGTLRDKDNVQRSFTGLLATSNDVDMIRFFGEDSSGFFNEEYNVKIRLESTDPSIGMCVYRHDTADHSSECFFDNEDCPPGRYYERDGTLVKEDGADYVIKVKRLVSGGAPTCTTYTVFMSNGL